MAFQVGDTVKAADYIGHIESKGYETELRLVIGGGIVGESKDREGYFWSRSDGSYNNVQLKANAGTGASSRARLYSVDFDAGGDEVLTLLHQVFDDDEQEYSITPGYYYYTLRVQRSPGPFDGASASVSSKPWQNTLDVRELWNATKFANSSETDAVVLDESSTLAVSVNSQGEEVSVEISAVNQSDNAEIKRGFMAPTEDKDFRMFLPAGTYEISTDVQSDAGSPASSVSLIATYTPKIRRYLDDLSDLKAVGGTVYEGGISFQDASNGLLGDKTLPGGIYGEQTI